MNRFARFLLVGTCGFLVDAGLLELLTRWVGVPALMARIPSFVVATWVTWHLNRNFTFNSKRMPTFVEWSRYFSMNILGLACNYVAFILVLSRFELARVVPSIAVAAGGLVAMSVNFFLMGRVLSGSDRM